MLLNFTKLISEFQFQSSLFKQSCTLMATLVKIIHMSKKQLPLSSGKKGFTVHFSFSFFYEHNDLQHFLVETSLISTDSLINKTFRLVLLQSVLKGPFFYHSQIY